MLQGHLGVLMAYMLPDCQVYLVENKEESLLKASSRLESLDLHNVTMYQCNLDYFRGTFNVGVCLHACGSATDMVLKLCLDSNASFVICPCCYGSIQKTHILCYPQSQHFETAGITYKEFLTLGHAADQTELNTALEEQGRLCMNLVDTDRAQLARELGYDVTLCSLKPLSCTPKNNLLFGTLNK
uniref:Methyltransferase domain-containing protein n=1 Tax=Arion vulgaris TaxID=1028688 RepID=A0A0B6ZDG7_9EUPU